MKNPEVTNVRDDSKINSESSIAVLIRYIKDITNKNAKTNGITTKEATSEKPKMGSIKYLIIIMRIYVNSREEPIIRSGLPFSIKLVANA